jgi:hypothetical protein
VKNASRLAIAAALMAACGGAAAVKRAPSLETPVKQMAHEAPDAADPIATFDELAKGADKLAPAMRELVRDEKSGEKSLAADLLQADKDSCVRVTFAATTELLAALEDQNGAVLAVTKAKAGALGERGPVCVRKGGALRVHFEGDGAIRVRFITWTSP